MKWIYQYVQRKSQLECLIYQLLSQTSTGIMIFMLCAKCTVNNSQRATIDVCGIGLWPHCKNLNRQGKIFNPNRLKEIIEILQSHILYSFTEQSIKKNLLNRMLIELLFCWQYAHVLLYFHRLGSSITYWNYIRLCIILDK